MRKLSSPPPYPLGPPTPLCNFILTRATASTYPNLPLAPPLPAAAAATASCRPLLQDHDSHRSRSRQLALHTRPAGPPPLLTWPSAHTRGPVCSRGGQRAPPSTSSGPPGPVPPPPPLTRLHASVRSRGGQPRALLFTHLPARLCPEGTARLPSRPRLAGMQHLLGCRGGTCAVGLCQGRLL